MSAKSSIIYRIYPFPWFLCQGLYLPRAISAKGSICQGIYLPSLMFNCLSVVCIANVHCPLLYIPRDLSYKPSVFNVLCPLLYCTVLFLPRAIFAKSFVYHASIVNFLYPLLCLPSALSPKSHVYQVIFMYVLLQYLPAVMSAKPSISQVPCLPSDIYVCPPTVLTRCYVCHDFSYAQYLLITFYVCQLLFFERVLNPPIAMSAKCYYSIQSVYKVQFIPGAISSYQAFFFKSAVSPKCYFC